MGRKLARGPRKKPPHIAAKKLAVQRLGRKRLSPTKAQRRARHAALEKAVGYKIPKLSEVVSKPSRYTVKKRVVQYSVKTRTKNTKTLTGYSPTAEGYSIHGNVIMDRNPQYTYSRREVVVSKTPVGEKLIVKRLRKGSSKKGSTRETSASRKTGTSAARRSRTKSRGMKAVKEARKKGKKKQKK